jgi:superfamily II DNA helicase RecQ
VLLSDLEQAGLVQRDQEGHVMIAVPLDIFRAGVRDLVAKLKTFRYEGERRLRAVANYAQSEECRSVFLRRYFGEENPPSCGTCDRCRAIRAAATRAGPSREKHSAKASYAHGRPARSARSSS